MLVELATKALVRSGFGIKQPTCNCTFVTSDLGVYPLRMNKGLANLKTIVNSSLIKAINLSTTMAVSARVPTTCLPFNDGITESLAAMPFV